MPELVSEFLRGQLHGDSESDADSSISNSDFPTYTISSSVSVFHSAVATFFAPSDLSGVGGMHSEWIRAHPNWRKSYPRYDTVFLEKDSNVRGFPGLHVARVFLFFSFKYQGKTYPCALIQWYIPVDESGPDDDVGMWMVKPEFLNDGNRNMSVVHLDCILRAAHLLPVFPGGRPIPSDVDFTNSLDHFKAFYVSKYADHRAFEILN